VLDADQPVTLGVVDPREDVVCQVPAAVEEDRHRARHAVGQRARQCDVWGRRVVGDRVEGNATAADQEDRHRPHAAEANTPEMAAS
jgi:hypothetical protein